MTRHRRCTASPFGTQVIHIEDHPTDPDRVIVTDRAGNRGDMSMRAVLATCTFADGVVLETDRIGWDG